MDPQTNLYLGYYKAQSGGQLPAFQGARRGQYGAGLGDILRGIFRTLFPIAAQGASTFLSETLKARDSGASGWGAAAKAAIAPTAQNVITNALDRVTGSSKQEGGRRKRIRTRKNEQRNNSRQINTRINGASSQLGGRARRKRKSTSYKSHYNRATKRIKFLNF